MCCVNCCDPGNMTNHHKRWLTLHCFRLALCTLLRCRQYDKSSRKAAYLALLQAGAVHIDGWEQVLEQGGCQLQMLFPTKVVHHYQGGVLHIKAGYLSFHLWSCHLLCVLYSLFSPKLFITTKGTSCILKQAT